MDEIKKKTFVRKDALEAEAAAKRKRRRPKGYLGCILGLSIGIAGLAAARLGHLWVGFDIFSQFTPQFMFLILAFAIGLFAPHGKVLTAVCTAHCDGGRLQHVALLRQLEILQC